MIRISSKRDGFRRAGMAHPKGPVEYPDDQFSEEQLKAMKAEAMLTVEEIKGTRNELNAERGTGNAEEKTPPSSELRAPRSKKGK